MTMEKVFDANTKSYTLAGWVSILHAIIILPKVGLEPLFEITSHTSSDYFQLIAGFHGVGMLMGIYVLYMFRRFLNERHNFHKVDLLITVLILFNAAGLLIDLAGLVLISYYDVIEVNWIVYGLSNLISIIYAVRLLKLDNDLSGLLRPYVYTTIAAGICGATLILSHLGNLIYMASLILLGIILIRARFEFEYL